MTSRASSIRTSARPSSRHGAKTGETVTVNQSHGGSSKRAYTYLAAWGCALRKRGTEATARDFVSKVFANVPVLQGGGRRAATTLTQRDVSEMIVAKHALRPQEEAVLQKFAGPLPAIKAFSVERTLGSWAQVQPTHFADGGICDEIVVNR